MIKKLIIHNLKAIESLAIEFNERTLISGRNGVGKSTIKEAITFVLYGKINNTDRIDEAIRNNANEASVTAVFSVNDKDVIVSRNRTVRGSELTINGRPAEQADINALFGLYDYFLCSNFIGEFMKFSESERRDILLNLFEPEDRKAIFTKLTGQDPSIVNLDDLDSTEKRLRAELRMKESERNLLSSQKETLNAELFRLKDEFNNLTKTEVKDYTNDILTLRNKLSAIKEAEPKRESFVMGPLDTTEFDEAIREIGVKSFSLSQPSREEVTALELVLRDKKREYEKLNGSTVCPTCNRPLEDPSHIKIRQTELASEMKRYYDDWKVKSASYESRLKEFENTRNKLAEERAATEAKRKEVIMSYEMTNEEMIGKYNSAVLQFKSDINVLEEELAKLSEKQNEYQISVMKYDGLKENIRSLSEKIDSIMLKIKQADTSDLETTLKAFGPKGIKFQEVLSQQERVNSILPKHIVVEFIKENKTNDGFKPTFNVISNGVSYPWLSTGMKMEVDMHLLSLFPGGKMAVVDNYEAYTGELPEAIKGRQIIAMSATKSDLTINAYEEQGDESSEDSGPSKDRPTTVKKGSTKKGSKLPVPKRRVQKNAK